MVTAVPPAYHEVLCFRFCTIHIMRIDLARSGISKWSQFTLICEFTVCFRHTQKKWNKCELQYYSELQFCKLMSVLQQGAMSLWLLWTIQKLVCLAEFSFYTSNAVLCKDLWRARFIPGQLLVLAEFSASKRGVLQAWQEHNAAVSTILDSMWCKLLRLLCVVW